jgi:hypothetical protein
MRVAGQFATENVGDGKTHNERIGYIEKPGKYRLEGWDAVFRVPCSFSHSSFSHIAGYRRFGNSFHSSHVKFRKGATIIALGCTGRVLRGGAYTSTSFKLM